MILVKRCFCLVIFQVAVCMNCVYAQLPIKIKACVWTDSVSVKNRSFVTRYGQKIPQGTVCLWVNAMCDHTVVGKLRTQGTLPILYKWFKKVGNTWISQGVLSPSDFINPSSFPDSLKAAINDHRSVMWSSWTIRGPADMTKGVWKVVVTESSSNEPLFESKIRVKDKSEND